MPPNSFHMCVARDAGMQHFGEQDEVSASELTARSAIVSV